MKAIHPEQPELPRLKHPFSAVKKENDQQDRRTDIAQKLDGVDLGYTEISHDILSQPAGP